MFHSQIVPEKKLVWQQMTAPGFKPLLFAQNRLGAPALLLSSSLFRGSFRGSVSYLVLFQHSSTADHARGTKKTLNNSMANFIAAGDSEYTMQERANSDAGQSEIPQHGAKSDEFFVVVVFALFVCLFVDLSLIFLVVTYRNIEHYL